ncbi:MAG: apolipoprotein N-acyltransferase, partial [Candidatus Aminicenantes bacterium]|nr:apolipoprotein N-acyltransferase [Candidatus Aminicenantes bacterium]
NTAYAKKILTQASQELGCPILLGGYGNRQINNKYVPTNSAIHVDPHKGMGKQYDKQFLVPFGEYMPFEKHLSFIYSKINWKSRFHPGDDSVVQKIQNIPYAFLICYEAIFPSLSRQAVNRGARLLINITFDAWFGRTTAPYQHLMLATIRSAEMGIPLIRLATTGITTTVNALGEMGDLSSLFKQEVLLYEVPLVYLPTIYSRIGDIFAWICIFTTVLSLILIAFKHQKSPSV